MGFCSSGFYHIIHLTQQVYKEDGFVVEIFQSMELLLVEVVHLLGCYYLVVVEVNHFKPIVKWLNWAFIFLAEHEVNKVFVAHFTGLIWLELSRHLIKDAVDCFAAQCVSLVATEVFFVYYKVVIGIELPKPTVKNVKVLVTKELPNFIYIVFFCNNVQNVE